MNNRSRTMAPKPKAPEPNRPWLRRALVAGLVLVAALLCRWILGELTPPPPETVAKAPLEAYPDGRKPVLWRNREDVPLPVSTTPPDLTEEDLDDMWMGLDYYLNKEAELRCPIYQGFYGEAYVPVSLTGDMPERLLSILEEEGTVWVPLVHGDDPNNLIIRDVKTEIRYHPVFEENDEGWLECLGLEAIEDTRAVTVMVEDAAGNPVYDFRVAGCGVYSNDRRTGVTMMALPPQECVLRVWCVGERPVEHAYAGAAIKVAANAETVTLPAPNFDRSAWEAASQRSARDRLWDWAPLDLPGLTPEETDHMNHRMIEYLSWLSEGGYGGPCNTGDFEP